MSTIRIGIVGLGANTRSRHVPGFRSCEDVQLVSVCNRRPESTEQAAKEFGIPKTFATWEDLVSDSDIDAVLIGTWPYLHCPITLAALEAGKHVLTEARMACSASEAHQMLEASRKHPQLVTQIVPSPMGFRGHHVVQQLLSEGYLGQLREVVVLGTNTMVADPQAPLHWRQSARLSGINMLALGILHETLIRWVPDPLQVLAQTQIFTQTRIDPTTGRSADVGTPDAVRVLTELPEGVRGLYHLSGVLHHGPGMAIHLYGTEGTLKYEFAPEDRLLGGRRGEPQLNEINVPPEKAGRWQVEEDFIQAIRGKQEVQLTDFATGVRYMEFTEAVARSARGGIPVALPLEDQS